MTTIDTITLPMPTLRLKVRLPRLYGFRIHLAGWLIVLAGYAAGRYMHIEIAGKEDETDPGF